MAVRIVTDSTADLPAELLQERRIEVVPLRLIFGDDQYRDGVDISSAQFYERLLSSDLHPTTSAPPPEDFKQTYERLLQEDDCDGIVSIHLSGELSRTLQGAEQARDQLNAGDRIRVLDTRSGSLGVGMTVAAAAKFAMEGASLEQVEAAVRKSIPKVHIYMLIDTLEFLRRGGRIGRASALLGTLLKMKPILTVKGGVIVPEKRPRTWKRGLEEIFQVLVRHSTNFTHLAIVHTTESKDAEHMRDRLHQLYPAAEPIFSRLSPVLGAHVGPGMLGIGGLVWST